ncbi:dolichyl-phosphate-mannose-protein mannosyltransferase [Rathayibacter sp. PhB151]|uniref:glycosyltransferase family 39 protein n=1 Tax=Rathayibacter sp. PhB151 TaxID=2485189 RepID=UPI0010D46B07|nr:glycosyltransferase family 39 protein [Rathayibacter sp. PhB151]TDX74556.1 dolichyl-phosphate-mannose-protein mannosyltransferase [Rathayibacter sp. PhB151]
MERGIGTARGSETARAVGTTRGTGAARAAAVLATLLWALWQCFGNLGAANISSDEPVYLSAGWSYLHGDMTPNLEHPPTAKYLIGLAQVLLGEGLLAGRIAAGAATLLTGVILWFWLKRELGTVLALIPAGLFLLFPRTTATGGTRIDRLALLEPFMVLFAVAAMAAAWTWARRGAAGERSGRLIAVAGVLFALSVTSKLTTLALAPVFLVPLLLIGDRRRALRGFAAFALAFLVTAVLAYLPVHPVEAIRYLLDFQSEHNASGHMIDVAGAPYRFPPWWANLWFMLSGVGPAALAVLVLGGLLALLAPRRRALVLYLAGATLLLLVFHLLISAVALPHYYVAWAWLLCVLAGVGIAEALRDGLVLPWRIARPAGVLLLVASLVIAAATSVGIVQERPTGIARVAGALHERGLDGGLVLVQGMSSGVYVPYIGDRYTTDPASEGIVAIAIEESARFPLDPRVEEYLATDPTVVQLDELRLVLTDGPLPAE